MENTAVGPASAASPKTPPTPPPGHPLDAVSARNTTVLVLFTSLTNLADGVTKVALPLLATQLTQSPAQVSGVGLTLTLPWLLTALHVGVLVDRFDRRRLLWVANLVRLAAIAALLATTITGTTSLPVLYLGGLALGVAEVIALTSAAALVPTAVAPGGLERANAWVAGAETVCNEFCGPFVGGILVAAGASVALGTTGAAYVAGMVVLALLVGRFAPRPDGDGPTGTVNQRIAEGLRFLWHQRLLRMMALALTVLCACWGAWLALMPLVATSLMGLDARQYGMLLSALGAGGLVGALTVSLINRLLGRRWAMFADLLGTAAMVAAPVLTTNLWLVAAGAFVGGMGGVLWTVNSRTISQRLVATELMGRYNAAARLFSWGAMPLGAGLVGVLAEWFGLRAAFAVFAVATLLVIVPFLRVVTPGALEEATARPAPD
ncbi:MAG TPA: MFS transporter [Streptomyces sp.]|uniref:MFS transporter n=1 Tax=Streptomyces sp. TaxID=1931 RepID=UPI002D53BC6D|nr:MFS transporter [Streptomyces sp.]HZG04684.1 MFS transporter [Streptomyces sp.]